MKLLELAVLIVFVAVLPTECHPRAVRQIKNDELLIYYKTHERYDLSDYYRPTSMFVPFTYKDYYMFPANVGVNTYLSLCQCRGYGNTQKLAVHNREQDTWQFTANIRYPRRYHQTAAVDKKVFVIGGENKDTKSPVKQTEMLDTSKDAFNGWVTVASMPYDAEFAAVAVVGKMVYVCGGFSEDSDDTIGTVLRYDTVNDKWTQVRSMVLPRERAAAVAYNGQVYVCGGLAITDQGYETTASCERYDPTLDQWTKIQDMRQPRFGFQLVVQNGKMYALGGYGVNQFRNTDSVEYLDLTRPNDNWRDMRYRMSDDRGYFSAVVNKNYD